MPDISTIADIQLIVDYHYQQLLSDPITKPKFSHVNIIDHMPTIYSFWGFLVLDIPNTYMGNAFQKHVPLNLEKIHFEKWLQFLNEGIDLHFQGDNADKMKEKANHLGMIFKAKLNIPLE
jgi:hemoglobin